MDAETTAGVREAVRRAAIPSSVDPAALERRFTIPERNRAIVREFREVLDKGYHGQEWRHAQAPLIGQDHRVRRDQAPRRDPGPDVRRGVRRQEARPRRSAMPTSSSPAWARTTRVDGQTKIKRFKKEEFPQILVSVNMLDTGFDCPEVVNLVMARFTQVAILYQQMRGRGTRKARPHQEGRLHHVRFRRRHRLPRRRRESWARAASWSSAPAATPPRSRAGCWSSTSTTTSTRRRASGSPSTTRARLSDRTETRRQGARARRALRGVARRPEAFNSRPGALAAHDRGADQGECGGPRRASTPAASPCRRSRCRAACQRARARLRRRGRAWRPCLPA